MTKVYVSVLFNREDSEIIGVYTTMKDAVKNTIRFLVTEEVLDYFNYTEDTELEGSDLSNEEFYELLRVETDDWNYSKLEEVFKKYNGGYDRENLLT